MNQKKVGVLLSYSSLGLGTLIGILYTPVMLQLLGKNEYGLYSLAASITGYLGLLNFGFTASYMHFYARCKANNDSDGIARINGMFLSIFTVIATITLLAGLVLVYYSDTVFGNKLTYSELETGKQLLLVLVINMTLSLPANVFYVYISAHERFVFQQIIGLIQVVVGPLAVLPILMMGYGSVGMVVVTTTLTLIINLSNIYFCFNQLKIRFTFKNLDFTLFKEMSIFSSFIFINIVIDQINWSVDNYILARTKGTASVAIYTIGSSLNKYYMSFAAIITSVFIPQINRLVSEKNDNAELLGMMIKIGRIQFILLSLIASGFVLFGRQFISLWVGNEYDTAYFIAMILILPATIPFLQSIGIEIQRAKNRHKFRSVTYFFIALINVAVSIPLAQRYGGVGCAIGTGVSLLVGNGLIMNWYYHYKIGLNMKTFWFEIIKFLPALVAPLVIGVLISWFFKADQFVTLGGAIFVYCTVFAISVWYLGINKFEKELVVNAFKKIKKALFDRK